jgi:hypothetical protein
LDFLFLEVLVFEWTPGRETFELVLTEEEKDFAIWNFSFSFV